MDLLNILGLSFDETLNSIRYVAWVAWCVRDALRPVNFLAGTIKPPKNLKGFCYFEPASNTQTLFFVNPTPNEIMLVIPSACSSLV